MTKYSFYFWSFWHFKHNIYFGRFSTASSKNGKKTMVWKEDESLELGGNEMSVIDKMQLNTYYKCKGYPNLTPEFKINKGNTHALQVVVFFFYEKHIIAIR